MSYLYYSIFNHFFVIAISLELVSNVDKSFIMKAKRHEKKIIGGLLSW